MHARKPRRHTETSRPSTDDATRIRWKLVVCLGKPSRGLFPFKIQNASITLLEKRDGRMLIGGVNDIAHLENVLVTEVGPG